MKEKKYFMELMGDIDDRMIQEAAAPWENSRVSAWWISAGWPGSI